MHKQGLNNKIQTLMITKPLISPSKLCPSERIKALLYRDSAPRAGGGEPGRGIRKMSGGLTLSLVETKIQIG